MIRRPPRSPRTDTLFPYPRSSDLLRVPRNPLALAGFGARGILPATWAGRAFRTEEAKALFAGAAAHAFLPLSRPFTTALGIMLLASGHVAGWPSAKGGSPAIADSMRSEEHTSELQSLMRTSYAVFVLKKKTY